MFGRTVQKKYIAAPIGIILGAQLRLERDGSREAPFLNSSKRFKESKEHLNVDSFDTEVIRHTVDIASELLLAKVSTKTKAWRCQAAEQPPTVGR